MRHYRIRVIENNRSDCKYKIQRGYFGFIWITCGYWVHGLFYELHEYTNKGYAQFKFDSIVWDRNTKNTKRYTLIQKTTP